METMITGVMILNIFREDQVCCKGMTILEDFFF